MSSLYSLQATEQSISAKADTLTSRLNTEQRSLETFRATYSETFTALATVYVPALTEKDIKQAPEEIRAIVQEQYDAQQTRKKILTTRLEHIDAEREEKETQRDAHQKIIKNRQDSYDGAEKEKTSRLQARPDYQSVKGSLAKNNGLLEHLIARLEGANALLAKFRPTYNADPVFIYFEDRGYGTEKPTGSKFFAGLDTIFAAITGYSREKEKLDTMINAQKMVEEQIMHAKKEQKVLQSRSENIEEEVTRILDIPSLRTSLDDALAEDKGFEGSLAKLAKEEKEKKGELAAQSPIDTYYTKAHTRVRDYITKLGAKELRALAKSTSTDKDDLLVDRLTKLTSGIEESEDIVRRLKNEQSSVFSELERARSAVQRERARIEEEDRRERARIAAIEAEKRRQDDAERAAARAREESYSSSNNTTSSFGGSDHSTTDSF